MDIKNLELKAKLDEINVKHNILEIKCLDAIRTALEMADSYWVQDDDMKAWKLRKLNRYVTSLCSNRYDVRCLTLDTLWSIYLDYSIFDPEEYSLILGSKVDDFNYKSNMLEDWYGIWATILFPKSE